MTEATDPLDWNGALREQLGFHWESALRPRLDGLTDEEYFWEPAPGCWSVRPRAEATTNEAAGGGDFVLEYVLPEPTPPPVTTIAWRLAHVTRGCLAFRTANHFGGPPADYDTWVYAGSADAALEQLDAAYTGWQAGVESLGQTGLTRAVGPAEGHFAEAPYADLVLHINRELIHHGAEICLLRDLYCTRAPQEDKP